MINPSRENAITQSHIEIAGKDLSFHPLTLDDATPTGRQILVAAGKTPHDQFVVLQWLAAGDIEEIRLEELVKSEPSEPVRVIVVEADRTFRFMLNDHSMEWPAPKISESALRILARIPNDQALFLRREDEADLKIEANAEVDLAARGTEEIYARVASWKLNVQGVIITSEHPTMSVHDAIACAGFDVAAAWVIVLKTAEGRQQVGLDYMIDLRLPGIEKLRLTPKEIKNGEAVIPPSRAFALLPGDEAGLKERGLNWTTLVDQGRRWLILHDLALPIGFTESTATVAMEIPPSYPAGEIDMFYVFPHLARRDGQTIPQTQIAQSIGGRSFQRWSRHRGPLAPWRPGKDSVLTHLTLIDASLSREVEL